MLDKEDLCANVVFRSAEAGIITIKTGKVAPAEHGVLEDIRAYFQLPVGSDVVSCIFGHLKNGYSLPH